MELNLRNPILPKILYVCGNEIKEELKDQILARKMNDICNLRHRLDEVLDENDALKIKCTILQERIDDLENPIRSELRADTKKLASSKVAKLKC